MAPTGWETTIDQLLATFAPEQASSVVPGYIRSLTPIIEPRLDASSATAWYLMAATARIDTVEYMYLSGEEGLQITTQQGFDVDGVQIKAKMRFAAKAIDWRGMFRNVGA